MRRALMQFAVAAAFCLTTVAAFAAPSAGVSAVRLSSVALSRASEQAIDRDRPERPSGPFLRRIIRFVKKMVGQEDQISIPKP